MFVGYDITEYAHRDVDSVDCRYNMAARGPFICIFKYKIRDNPNFADICCQFKTLIFISSLI